MSPEQRCQKHKINKNISFYFVAYPRVIFFVFKD
jgi:hypothetical protein